MKTILFVVNPNAGAKTEADFERALTAELSRYPDVTTETLIPESPEWMRTELRQRFSNGMVDILAVVGGDGTIMEVLPLLIEFPNVQLALIPYGTGNLLAANLNIPKDFAASLETAFTGKARRIDMARINNNYFVLIAGVGVVADIMENTPRHHKKWLGPLAYLINGLRTVWAARRSRLTVTTENRVYKAKGIAVVVSNAASILGPCVPLTPDAEPDDGLLDVCIIRSRTNQDYFATLWEAMWQTAPGMLNRNLIRFQAQRVHIESSKTLTVQADGNLIGTTPVDIEIIRNRLQVMVPLAEFEALPESRKRQSESSLLETLKCYTQTAQQEAKSGLRR